MTTIDALVIERKPKIGKSRKPRNDRKGKNKKEPKYHVILHNDDYNTFEHVINILVKVLGMSVSQGFVIAREAHTTGQAIVFTGSLQQAELIRDKIFGFAPASHSPAVDIEPTRLIASLQKASE